MSNPMLHDAAFNRKNKDTKAAAEGAEDAEANEDAERGEDEHFTNQRLMTPRMRKLMPRPTLTRKFARALPYNSLIKSVQRKVSG